MAPSESDILTHYLLIPAPLTAIITLDQFRALFPATWQSSPQVAKLFRDLQSQRAQVVDKVTENIEAEARRGTLMRREVLRARMESEREDVDAEIDIERALFGSTSGAKVAKHTLRSIVPELKDAAMAMEAEIEKLQEQEDQLFDSIAQTIDDLKDLQYGEMSSPQLRDQVLDDLISLQEACSGKT